MDYIQFLKKQNITFHRITEKKASRILQEECSFLHLQRLSNLFEKYQHTEKKGKFIHTDFSQVYYISKIDEDVSHIFMTACLKIEKKLKIILLNDAYKVSLPYDFFIDFFASNQEYIKKGCPDDIQSLFFEQQNDAYITLQRIIDFAPFGIFINLFVAFYERYAILLYHRKSFGIESLLNSIRAVRNKVAHTIPLLDSIKEKNHPKNSRVYAYLTQKGIAKRTLHTNLSNSTLFDICCTLHLFATIHSKRETHLLYQKMRIVLKSWKRQKKYFTKCNELLSAMEFLSNIAKIYSVPVTFLD